MDNGVPFKPFSLDRFALILGAAAALCSIIQFLAWVVHG